MKMKEKLIILVGIFLLAFSTSLTAEAASLKFNKNVYVVNEGKKVTVKLKNSTKKPKIKYYDEYSKDIFSYKVLSNKKIRITAKKAGVRHVSVKSGSKKGSFTLVVMPKKNPAIKKKAVATGTAITYNNFSLTLPKVWKKNGYVILTGDDYMTFCAKGSYKTGYFGHVFSINWCTVEEWSQIQTYLPNFTHLKTSGDTVYYLTEPTDVQFNTSSDKLRKQYNQLTATMKKVKKSFKLK